MITTINEFKNNLNESITFSLEDLKDLGYNSKAEFNDKIKQEVKNMMKHTSGLKASECKKEILKTFQDQLKDIKKKKEKTNESLDFIDLEKLINIANFAGDIVLDAKDSLLELGEVYGEKIPYNKVLNILNNYDIDLEDMDLNESVMSEEEERNNLENLLYVGDFEI